LNDGDHSEIAQASSLDEFDESNELGSWVCTWGIEDEIGVVQHLLLASVLDGHQDLSRHSLLFEDLFFGFVQISFSIFGVG
jgi:hypothetical protein